MPKVDTSILEQPQRLAAARRARRLLPGLAMPLDAIARLAARVTGAPMAIVAVTDVVEEHFVGSFGLPQVFTTGEPVPVAYSVCKYIVSADHPVSVDDMSADPDLRSHALAMEYDARAFAGVPLRDAADRTVGSLLVVDVVPRAWTGEQLELLVEISTLLAGLPPDGVYTNADAMAGLDAAAVLDGVQEAFVAIDVDGRVRGWNPAAQRLLGWSATEVNGRRAAELLLRDADHDSFHRSLPDLIASTGPQSGWTGRIPIRHRDGHQIPARAVASTLRGRYGPLIGVFLTDLTRQSHAERDAGRQRGFLTALLDSLTAPVAAMDSHGRLQVANRAMRRLHGLPENAPLAALLAVAPGHLFRPDGTSLPWEQAPLMRALDGEHVRDHEILIAVPGEPVRTMLTNAQPIITADDTQAGAVSACRDITERRRVERFRDCQLAVATALAYTGDVDSSADDITRAVAVALGWPHIELWLHDELTDAVRLAGHHSTLGAAFGEFLSRPVDKGVGVSGTAWATAQPLWIPNMADTPYLNGAATAPWVRMCAEAGLHTMMAAPISADGHVVGVLTCFAASPEHDRTSLTTLLAGIGEQLGQFLASRRSAQLAQEVTRGKDDFLSLVGHEMRTPLTVISSYIDMLLTDDEPHTDDTRRLHEAIARATDTLRAIVDDLLDLAGLESGHLSVSLRQIDLSVIAGQALHRVQAPADANGVTVTADLPERLVTTGDPQRLRQLMDNLLSNAVKYSPDGGNTTLTLTYDEHAVAITITDTGIGVPPGEHPHLFDRFYRASNARHSAVAGNGLGLSIVRAIAEAHHGTVTLDDIPDGGTSIIVRLPHTSAAA
ncbi:ATP-binding protein [Actinoplanes sp. NPDC051346]|uniref:ATP-binding protein n=1 Tax=Actinoplanes sp. NPDC051346 TaxID=3155048 RepID=UPI003438967A